MLATTGVYLTNIRSVIQLPIHIIKHKILSYTQVRHMKHTQPLHTFNIVSSLQHVSQNEHALISGEENGRLV